jgi:hypothetical protein
MPVHMEKPYALKVNQILTTLVKEEYGKRINAGRKTGPAL